MPTEPGKTYVGLEAWSTLMLLKKRQKRSTQVHNQSGSSIFWSRRRTHGKKLNRAKCTWTWRHCTPGCATTTTASSRREKTMAAVEDLEHAGHAPHPLLELRRLLG